MSDAVEGLEQLQYRLGVLGGKVAERISVKASRAAVTRVRTAIRKQVPTGQGRDSKGRFTKSQKTEQLKKAIGLRVKSKSGEVISKAGVAVGKSKAIENTVGRKGVKRWYLRLFATGTAERHAGIRRRQYKHTAPASKRGRKRKPGLSIKLTGNPVAFRGSIEGDDFVLRGFNSSKGAAVDAMAKTLQKELDKEVQALR